MRMGRIQTRLATERSTHSTSSFAPRRWRQYLVEGACFQAVLPPQTFISPASVLYLHLMIERLKESPAYLVAVD